VARHAKMLHALQSWCGMEGTAVSRRCVCCKKHLKGTIQSVNLESSMQLWLTTLVVGPHADNQIASLTLTPAGTIIASLLPLSSAKPLGIDSAEADASECESRSGSSSDVQADEDNTDTGVAAR